MNAAWTLTRTHSSFEQSSVLRRMLEPAGIKIGGNRPFDIKITDSARFARALRGGAFRARELQLWQIVLSPGGLPGGYVSER